METEHAREQRQTDMERMVLELAEVALADQLLAGDSDWTDHLEMRLPDGSIVSVTVQVTLP